MEFKTDKKQLENALSRLTPYLEKKDTTSVATNVYLEVNGFNLTLNATNYDFGLKLEMSPVQDCVDGKVLINGMDLLNVIKRLKDGEVHIKATDKKVQISQGRSKLRLDCLNTNDYPSLEIRNFENMKELIFDTNSLYDGIKSALFSIDPNSPKIELQCLLLDFKDTLKVVSTDTRSLTIYDTRLKVDIEQQLLIPRSSIVEIQKIILDDCKVYIDDVHMVIESEGLRFFTKLISGKFPAYERIVPTSFDNSFIVPLKEFTSNIKLITSLDNIIRVNFSTDNIHIETAGEERQPSETDIEYKLEVANPLSIKLNATQLLNALSNIDSEVFTIGINETNMPLVIEHKNYKVINMPVLDKKD